MLGKAIMPRIRKTSGMRRSRGFEPTALFVRDNLRTEAERRGFALVRVLACWPEVVGKEIGSISKPVKVTFDNRSGLATLTLSTPGARSTELQMQVPRVIERVNSQYGYRAIVDVKIVHAPAAGFRESAMHFEQDVPVAPEHRAAATAAVGGVENEALRLELLELGERIYANTTSSTG